MAWRRASRMARRRSKSQPQEKRCTIPVQVSGSHRPRLLHFENDILPILSRFGCNSSGCHGKADGQNGFKLSIFGFDPRADRMALLEEGRGRRIFVAAPDESLMLKKATGSVPHGGGVRIRASPEYRLLREWIAAGAPEGDPAAPHIVSIQVTPRERRLGSMTPSSCALCAVHRRP